MDNAQITKIAKAQFLTHLKKCVEIKVVTKGTRCFLVCGLGQQLYTSTVITTAAKEQLNEKMIAVLMQKAVDNLLQKITTASAYFCNLKDLLGIGAKKCK